jgi:FkbM family methyltransferase
MSTRAYFEQQGRAGASAVPYANDRILCRAINRFKMFVSSKDTSVGPHLALDGIWEPWVTACVFSAIQPGMHCCNVGANVGYYTLLLGACVGSSGSVHAMECNPAIFELCRDNVFLNGMNGWVTVHKCAGGSSQGVATYQVDETLPGSGYVNRGVLRDDWNKQTVRVDTVDNIVNGGKLDFLMVDAEGSEPEVIEGAADTIDRNPQLELLLEWAPEGFGVGGARRLGEKLFGYGYKAFRVLDLGDRQQLRSEQLFAISEWDMVWFRR